MPQLEELRAEVAHNLRVFNALGDGRRGQEEDQGMGNYYLVDPVESRNLSIFLNLTRERGNTILDVACGDGVEAEVLIRQGFEVTAFDLSSNLVDQTAQRLRSIDMTAVLYVDDMTALQADRYPTDFAGVMFAQAACFVPVSDPKDSLMNKVVCDLAARTESGVFYYSTTHYDNPRHVRDWKANGEIVGSTVLHHHPVDQVAEMIVRVGFSIVHTDLFSSTEGDYRNDYIIATRD